MDTSFKVVATRTPDAITPKVLAACKKLFPAGQPRFVKKLPWPFARINKCTYNVKEYLQATEGEMALGWDISVWENVMMQCIGHAVVKIPHTDEMFCVTPSKYGETQLLFVPDPTITFDFGDENARMPSADVALSTTPEVARLITINRREREIKMKYPVSAGILLLAGADALEVQRLGRERQRLTLSILLATSNHNTPCPCGSGKKFRKCHRASVERMLLLA